MRAAVRAPGPAPRTAAAQPRRVARRGEARRPPERRGLAGRAAELSGRRLPSFQRGASAPRPAAGGNKLITSIPAQSTFSLDVNHGGAGLPGLNGVHRGERQGGREEKGIGEEMGEET